LHIDHYHNTYQHIDIMTEKEHFTSSTESIINQTGIQDLNVNWRSSIYYYQWYLFQIRLLWVIL